MVMEKFHFESSFQHYASHQSTSKLDNVKEEDIRGALAYFWKSDGNLDGKLDLNEYTDMIKSLGMNLSKRDISKAFNVADNSCQGFVSFMDYVTTYINEIIPGVLTYTMIQEVYQGCDKGSKGYLTTEEFRQSMKVLGNVAQDEKLDMLMISASKHAEGKLNFNDFCGFLGLILCEGH